MTYCRAVSPYRRWKSHGSYYRLRSAYDRRSLMFLRLRLAATVTAILALMSLASPARAGKRGDRVQPVNTIRVPNGGIQPQLAIDGKGVLHMVYFAGEPAHGDLYYVRSRDGGDTFSAPIKVNSHPGSAIATGNIRGAHVAIGGKG